ncbi:MAG: hypothetical protein ACREBS_08255 [Nitrososphaerales archaeon]
MQEIETTRAPVPNDASQIAKYEVLNYRRSKRFRGLLALMLGASVAASLVVGYDRPSSMMSDSTSWNM